MAQRRLFPLGSGSHKHGLQLRNEVARTLLRVPPRLRGIQHKSDSRGVLGLGNLIRQILDTSGLSDAHGQMETLLREFGESVQARAATRKDKPGRNLGVQTSAPQIVRDERKKFLRARFDNVREHA